MKIADIMKGKFFCSSYFLLACNSFAAEGMPQFNAKSFISQLFWLIITFTALYLIITYFILPRIRENIRLRKNKIANDLERAESIKEEIENIIFNEKPKKGIYKVYVNLFKVNDTRKQKTDFKLTIKSKDGNPLTKTGSIEHSKVFPVGNLDISSIKKLKYVTEIEIE